jgi:hypothetical protein
MIKRILPIYHTGWFYLFLLFWSASFWYISIGGLNQLNQVNINLLSQLKPSVISSEQNPALDTINILTLHSTFKIDDIVPITTLLSLNPRSQITLLGQPSDLFIEGIENYLSLTPRQKKIVISSPNRVSDPILALKPTIPFPSLLNWARFSSKENTERSHSPYFIFSPFIHSQRNSFPILLQHKKKPYLSAPGEILNQLSSNTELSLKQSWQLSLINQKNTVMPKELSLGFLGEIFITENLTFNSQESMNNDIPVLQYVRPFIKNIASSNTVLINKYDVIIIFDNNDANKSLFVPLLNKILKYDYLYQSLATLIFTWLLLFIGLALLWLIRYLSVKKQLISVCSFILLTVFIQYVLAHQQQWFEIIPIIMAITGTWVLLLGYQKEYRLFLAVFNHQNSVKNRQSSSITAITTQKQKNTPVIENQAPKLNQKQLDTKKESSQYCHTILHEEDLEQTFVILDSPIRSNAHIKHHLTVNSFGRYQVEGILGKGAMGTVYQGVDPKINRHVAIKTLQLSEDVDSPTFEEAKERFFKEAQTAGGLSHANIVTIYDVGEENNLGYIAMDLLTGAPLSLFTQPEQTLPIPLVYQLLIQITDALDYAHKQNVVHRDIKPANIIYDDDLLKVTVTDFGIAYVSDNSKTRTGIIMGSPYYMSPEQILGLKVDGRSDIFSLGVTFYQLLCGHLPFEGQSIATVAYQITKTKAIAVNQQNTKLPASALRITNKAMHKDLEKRYQTMNEFKLALINALKRDFKVIAN